MIQFTGAANATGLPGAPPTVAHILARPSLRGPFVAPCTRGVHAQPLDEPFETHVKRRRDVECQKLRAKAPGDRDPEGLASFAACAIAECDGQGRDAMVRRDKTTRRATADADRRGSNTSRRARREKSFARSNNGPCAISLPAHPTALRLASPARHRSRLAPVAVYLPREGGLSLGQHRRRIVWAQGSRC